MRMTFFGDGKRNDQDSTGNLPEKQKFAVFGRKRLEGAVDWFPEKMEVANYGKRRRACVNLAMYGEDDGDES